MSYIKSNLTDLSRKYGYDIVVATTQGSINDQMERYFDRLRPPKFPDDALTFAICYVGTDTTFSKLTLDKILEKTKSSLCPDGVNPFLLSENIPLSDPRLKALYDIGFSHGFLVKIGLPAGWKETLLDYVILHPGVPGTLTFVPPCHTFELVRMTRGASEPENWEAFRQVDGTPWFFPAGVDLKLETMDPAQYATLPDTVRQKHEALGTQLFDVRQFLLNLHNPKLEKMPTITGVDPGTPLHTALQNDFLTAYFEKMKTCGMPALNYALCAKSSPDSSLKITDIAYEISLPVDSSGKPIEKPTPEQQSAQCLSYLCATNGHKLPAAERFSWNWIEPSEQKLYTGTIAINRKTLAQYLANKIQKQLGKACCQPIVHVENTVSGLSIECQLPNKHLPTYKDFPLGKTAGTFSWSASAKDSSWGGLLGSLEIRTSLDVSMDFKDSSITITQKLVVYYNASIVMVCRDSGNVVEKTIKDTFTFGISQTGNLEVVHPTPSIVDSSKPLEGKALDVLAPLKAAITKLVLEFQSPTITDLTTDFVQNFIFPAAETYTFSGVCFSRNQDLVAHITCKTSANTDTPG